MVKKFSIVNSLQPGIAAHLRQRGGGIISPGVVLKRPAQRPVPYPQARMLSRHSIQLEGISRLGHSIANKDEVPRLSIRTSHSSPCGSSIHAARWLLCDRGHDEVRVLSARHSEDRSLGRARKDTIQPQPPDRGW